MRRDPARNALLVLTVLVAGWMLFAWLSGQSPLQISLERRLLPPGSAHWFGTDDLGRDLFSRVIAGTALTVGLSVAALLSSLAMGVFLGAAAGYWYNQWPDRLICWLADVLVSVPFLLLIAAVLSVTGTGLVKAYAVLTAIMWVNSARIVRAEVIKTWTLDYVSAERALGAQDWKVMLSSVLPACIGTAIMFSVGYLPEIIALEAGLSFLGLGVQPPHPSLGKMIFEGLNYLSAAWWLAVVPAAALFLIVMSVRLASAYATRASDEHNEVQD